MVILYELTNLIKTKWHVIDFTMEIDKQENSENIFKIQKDSFDTLQVFKLAISMIIITIITVYTIQLFFKEYFNSLLILLVFFISFTLISSYAYIHYKNLKLEVIIDKSHEKIICQKTAPKLKILRIINFSRIKYITYYRDQLSWMGSFYFLALILKNHRKFKIFYGDGGLCREFGIEILKLSKKSLVFSINFKVHILLNLFAISILITSLMGGNILAFVFSVLIFLINLTLVRNFKEKKRQDEYLKNYLKLEKLY